MNVYKIIKTDEDYVSDTDEQKIELTDLCENGTVNDCAICLEKNDLESIQLNCGCKNKFHSKCIESLNKSKINKCPICRKNINSKSYENYSNECGFMCKNLIGIFIIIHAISLFLNLGLLILMILHPSELKYCDNNYIKCEYLPIQGELYLNKINKKYNDFVVEYELTSSYNYTINSQIYRCEDIEIHKYNSYEEAFEVSRESIGVTKQIYYNRNTMEKCLLEYRWYNLDNFHFISLGLIILGLNLFLILTASLIGYLESSNTNLKSIKLFIGLVHTLGIASIQLLSILQLCLFYFILNYNLM